MGSLLALALMFPGTSVAQPELDGLNAKSRGRLVLSGSLLSARRGFGAMIERAWVRDTVWSTTTSWGLGDIYFQVLGAGVGYGTERLSAVLGTCLGEMGPSGYPGDFMLAGSPIPLYIHLYSGLQGGRLDTKTTLHAFVGGSLWAGYGMPYVHAGIGIEERWLVLTPAIELRWRRVWSPVNWLVHNDFISLGVRLDLGGTWPDGN